MQTLLSLLVLASVSLSGDALAPVPDRTPYSPSIKTVEASVMICQSREKALKHYLAIMNSRSIPELFDRITEARSEPDCHFGFVKTSEWWITRCHDKMEIEHCAAVEIKSDIKGNGSPGYMSVFPQNH